ncbi:MAG: hypothetical protein IJM62_00100, partial [Lachnospiraceae bacterium]|nr:hypothetical protein [Lachnospiraceae bacterium]
ATYTKAVDNGTYKYVKNKGQDNEIVYTGEDAFKYDAVGYGLCQWTYYTRKAKLYQDAKADGRSVGNLYLQLEHLYNDLSANSSWSTLANGLKNAKSVDEATNLFYGMYERGSTQSLEAPAARKNNAQRFYQKFARYYQ